jgi:hypothetical protein
MRIEFPHCVCEWEVDNRRFVARFHDGTVAHGTPHETEAYREHAAAKSTGDIDDYCWQHDLAHAIIGLMNGGPSVVLWACAHNLPLDTPECEAEELAAGEFQKRFFRR